MDNTTYIALSRQQSLWNQLQVIANNLANVNTTGFKGSDSLFSQYVYRVHAAERPFEDKLSYTHDFGLVRNLSQGTMNYTGNSLDLAINGPGYFVVQGPAGTDGQAQQNFYTRDGAFTVDGTGQLVTQSGLPVMSTNGAPIIVPPNSGAISVQGDGVVTTQNGGAIGTLHVVRFDDERTLKAVDGTQFAAEDGQQPIDVPTPSVAQGVLEDSNVNAITEMTQLINVNRAYADVAKLIDEEHTRVMKAADTFTKQVTA